MAIMRLTEASAMYLRIHAASATITANIDMAMMISNIVGFMSLISMFCADRTRKLKASTREPVQNQPTAANARTTGTWEYCTPVSTESEYVQTAT